MEVSGQLHASAALTLGKEPHDIHWIEEVWVGPRTGLVTVERSLLVHFSEMGPVLPCWLETATILGRGKRKFVSTLRPD
jgi:hypothetical protein